jgi:hypothetical protein
VGMEAVRDFLPFADADQARSRSVDSAVDEALAVLRSVGSTAVADAASWGFQAASDFAGQVEELSRAAEYLQLVAAGAVDRTRKQATAGPGAGTSGWTTGWRDTPTAGGAAATPGAGSLGAFTAATVSSETPGDGVRASEPPARTTERCSAPTTTTSSTKNNGPSNSAPESPGSSHPHTSTPTKDPSATTTSNSQVPPPPHNYGSAALALPSVRSARQSHMQAFYD